MTFYGRETEKNKINRMLKKETLQTILICGRYRVGKSELIRHCLIHQEVPFLNYECRETTEKGNIENLALLISEQFHLPPLSFSSMENLLEYLFKKAEDEKLVLVLDEYPYLRETIRRCDSILQSLRIFTVGFHFVSGTDELRIGDHFHRLCDLLGGVD